MTEGAAWKAWRAEKRRLAFEAVAKSMERESVACLRCGTELNLQLHHRIKYKAPGQDWWRTTKEATLYPSRFVILCKVHHLGLHASIYRKTKRINPLDWNDAKVVYLMAKAQGEAERKLSGFGKRS